jgi:PhnB protein
MTQAIPAGMSTISPHLVCAGAADAIEFYKRAFGAKEMARLAGPDGRLMHGCIRIGGSTVLLVDEYKEWGMQSPLTLGGTPVTVHLYVPDVDAFVARAVEAGATVTMPVQDMFWGDRYGVMKDPFGHSWSAATHQRDVTPEEIKEAMAKSMGDNCQAP